ncbi:MAG: hypothetical protein B7Z73_19820 [Planctomycetia bacterium 21-64-5]|nr:MAG: hypothetical protein B7Z73_19820 [Planctomycetia bacterium 21-64-5]
MGVNSHSEKCPSCGKQHVPGFAFCQRCGAPMAHHGGQRPRAAETPQAQPDLTATDRLENAVVALLEDGKKDEALRAFREATGADTARALTAIELLEQRIDFIAASPRALRQARGRSPRKALRGLVAAVKAAIQRCL